MTKVSSAIVLCAGRGKRLQPHTDTTPKPLLAVAGKPTLDFILDSLKRAGIDNVVLVTNHLAEQVKSYAESQAFFPTKRIICVEQQQLAGTADAAKSALDAKPEWFIRPFILTASDYLVPPLFYESIVKIYQDSGKAIAISVKQLPEQEQAMRSSVRFDQHGYVQEIVEKPAAGTAPSIFSANLVFVLPPDIANAISQVEPSVRGEKEIQSAINEYLAEHGPGCSLEQEAPAEWSPALL